MGDMADFALDTACDEMEHFDRYSESDLISQYNEGLIDEHGATIGAPWSTPTVRPISVLASKGAKGAGACPKCGGQTVLKSGVYGDFYGCTDFPLCKGSRGI